MVSRSLLAGKSSMPLIANMISGKTSVCSSPLVEAWRSASVPGSAAAWPAKPSTPASSRRSAKSSTLSAPRTRTSSQQKTAGPSAARAPSATTSPTRTSPLNGLSRPKTTSAVAKAAARPTSAVPTWSG